MLAITCALPRPLAMSQLSWVYEEYPHVEIVQYSGLTIDFAESIKANYIMRGVRNSIDLDYEKSIKDAEAQIENLFKD
mgnify:CR=1 FL=1